MWVYKSCYNMLIYVCMYVCVCFNLFLLLTKLSVFAFSGYENENLKKDILFMFYCSAMQIT